MIYLHSRIDRLIKINALLFVIFLDIRTELFITNLIPLLILPIIWEVFLDSIVSEVDRTITAIK